MAYNRTLDLLAMSLAYSQADMPVKAANYMHAAATDPSAKAAVDAIFAANKKKKPAKKKAKASNVFAELEDMDGDEDDTVAALRAALEGEDDTVECETEDEVNAPVSAKVRAARKALAEAMAEEDESVEESSSEDEADVFTLKSSKRAKADASDPLMDGDMPGDDEREEVPATRSKASFARALRNIAARQK